MMRILCAVDPYQDRWEDRGSLLTVRNNRLWIWPSYAPNLQLRFVTLSVEVRLHCVLESFAVYIPRRLLSPQFDGLRGSLLYLL